MSREEILAKRRVYMKAWRLRPENYERVLATKRRDAKLPHRKARFNEMWRERTKFIQWLKLQPCMDCGQKFHPVCMDFDHRPGEEKRFSIGLGGLCSIDKLQGELMKCDLICSNCHRFRTHVQRKIVH